MGAFTTGLYNDPDPVIGGTRPVWGKRRPKPSGDQLASKT
jgi:hypothetical protein